MSLQDTIHTIQAEQFGFRDQHSILHQVERIAKLINKKSTQRNSTGKLCLDIEKTFDLMWHSALIYKHNTFWLPVYSQKMVQNFLVKRSFVAKMVNGYSLKWNTYTGLLLGSVFSLKLYLIYTALKLLRKQSETLHADDTAIIATGKVSNKANL